MISDEQGDSAGRAEQDKHGKDEAERDNVVPFVSRRPRNPAPSPPDRPEPPSAA